MPVVQLHACMDCRMVSSEPQSCTLRLLQSNAFFYFSPRISGSSLALYTQPQTCCAVEESEHPWLAKLLAEHWSGLKKAVAKRSEH